MKQEARLNHILEVCRHLWNGALADRCNTWKEEGTTGTYNQQAALLRIEAGQNRYPGVHSQVLHDVLKWLNRAFANFFRRVREGAEKKGDPRFKSRYKPITCPQSGFKLEGSRLNLSKIPGRSRIFMYREIEGMINSGRVHACSACGLRMDRDHNAAQNILTPGLRK